jgi:Na+/H+ antiporter NhaD/arsenite permease-like protein
VNVTQWTALGIFALSYGLIMSGKIHRAVAATLGAILMALFVIPAGKLIAYENWPTLSLVFGLMVVVSILERVGFFRWVALRIARAVRPDPLRLFIVLPLVVAVLSALFGSLTAMLLMTNVTLDVTELAGLDALPLLLSEIAASNIGGVATMIGNPPNIILGTFARVGVLEFSVHMIPVALLALSLNIVLFIWLYRVPIFSERSPSSLSLRELEAKLRDSAPRRSDSLLRLYRDIDWGSLVFFAGLFLIAGGLEEAGFLEAVSRFMLEGTGTRPALIQSVVLWFSAIASSFIDNVPMAATMAPILNHLSTQGGLALLPIVWAAVLGTDIGGNGTPIGASANVVAVATYEKRRGRRVSWAAYCRVSYPVMMVVTAFVNFYLIAVLHP